MEDLGGMKFISLTTNIRSIQPVDKHENKKRRYKRKNENEEEESKQDTFQLSGQNFQESEKVTITSEKSITKETRTTGILGDHIDVRI